MAALGDMAVSVPDEQLAKEALAQIRHCRLELYGGKTKHTHIQDHSSPSLMYSITISSLPVALLMVLYHIPK